MADDSPDAAPAAPSETTPAASPESRLWAAIQHWRDAHLAGGLIARTTEGWNHLQSALSHLTAAILKEL